MTTSNDNTEQVFDYHEQTKHRFDGYARGPQHIDWDAQPDSFRRFDGAPQIELPLQDSDSGLTFAELSTGRFGKLQDWNATSISRLLQFSMALSAWKQYGPSRWSLRCNPSSGNLHPTETYLILLGLDDFEDGLYHYRADRHRLELRCRYSANQAQDKPVLLLGFSSVHWREAWKYGERAYRYCQLDVGHAIAAVSYAARLLGYASTPQLNIGTAQLQQLFGLDRKDEFYSDEAEHADLLMQLHAPSETALQQLDGLINNSMNGDWSGNANRLDPRHMYDWPIIEKVAQACQRPPESHETIQLPNWPDALPATSHKLSTQPASKLLLQRRSAQAFDSNGKMSQQDFFRLLDRVLPRNNQSPWAAQQWPTRLHLAIFVHAVEGLAPGLYMLARDPVAVDMLKNHFRDDLLWQKVSEAPQHLPLYCLAQGSAQRMAMRLSCQQAIAGDSVFSLGMLAEFETPIQQASWHYNELYWEAGMLGQVLYLEAEAIGLRGTGIGCFFDDGVHEVLGLPGKSLQSVYHFTVGLPLDDARLITLPPYAHLQQQD
ncbi:MAG: SagB/ThcOx family dehydrogenase [Chromatiales bacterium]|jgi:SagB-type dehydrogenase family enzyme